MSDDIDVYRTHVALCFIYITRGLLQDPLIREDDQEVLWPSGLRTQECLEEGGRQ